MRVSSSEEQELIERFMKGEREAFEELYELIDPQLRGHLRGCYGPQDKDALQEILQMTYVYLLEGGPAKYDPSRSSFRRYAKYIAEKMAQEYYKQQHQWGWVRVIRPDHAWAPSELSDDIEDWLARNSEAYQHKAHRQSEELQYLELTENPQLAAEALDAFFHLAFDPATNPPHQSIAFGFAHLCRDLERGQDAFALAAPAHGGRAL
jgi:DNA-directed RNA polymerase specialized sigma24 family protein